MEGGGNPAVLPRHWVCYTAAWQPWQEVWGAPGFSQERGSLCGEDLFSSSHCWGDWIQFSLTRWEALSQLCSQASFFAAKD